jgi:hypothetical protein
MAGHRIRLQWAVPKPRSHRDMAAKRPFFHATTPTITHHLNAFGYLIAPENHC